MKIETSQFGQVEIDQDQIITFSKGIPGLEHFKRYAVLPLHAEENPFFYMQSIDDPDLGFVLVQPFTFFPHYEIVLDASTVKELEIKEDKEVLIFTMVTLSDTLQTATTNLRAPIVIGSTTRKAKQMVLEKSDYLIKQPLFATAKASKIESR